MYNSRSSVVLLICSMITLTFSIINIVNHYQNKEDTTTDIEIVEEVGEIDNTTNIEETFKIENEIIFDILKGGKKGSPYLTTEGKVYESYCVIENKTFEEIVDDYIGYYEYILKGLPNPIRMNVYSIEDCSSNEWLVTYFYELNSGLVWREKNVTSDLRGYSYELNSFIDDNNTETITEE